MANFGWDYPPGVTGNEPQISGIYPIEDIIDVFSGDFKKITEMID